MNIPIFGLSASVDIRPLPPTWVAELLDVVLAVQDHKKIKFLMAIIAVIGSLRIKSTVLNINLYFFVVSRNDSSKPHIVDTDWRLDYCLKVCSYFFLLRKSH